MVVPINLFGVGHIVQQVDPGCASVARKLDEPVVGNGIGIDEEFSTELQALRERKPLQLQGLFYLRTVLYSLRQDDIYSLL